MPRDKKKKDESGGSSWLTTYGDMMTLLLAFFVLLFSFSVIDAEKFNAMMEGLQGKLGVLDGGRTISSANLVNSGLSSNRVGSMPLNNLHSQISQYISQQGIAEDVSLEMTEEGLIIRFSGKILFGLGQAEIKEDVKATLNKVTEFIKTVPNDIVVEGHTDNWPISNSEFPSNWELSTTRATNVIRYFIEENDLSPSRLSAAGYSKYKPIKLNDTIDNRAINRRVDVIILKMDEEEEVLYE